MIYFFGKDMLAKKRKPNVFMGLTVKCIEFHFEERVKCSSFGAEVSKRLPLFCIDEREHLYI